MEVGSGLLALGVAVAFAWVLLRPANWRHRGKEWRTLWAADRPHAAPYWFVVAFAAIAVASYVTYRLSLRLH